jgi:hypothetical protein
MTGQRKNLTAEIMAEIVRAIERLGGDSKTLSEAPSIDDLVDCLRASGADRYLIGTFASWKDTIEDEEVRDDLRRLNEGIPYFKSVIASRRLRSTGLTDLGGRSLPVLSGNLLRGDSSDENNHNLRIQMMHKLCLRKNN